jgi:hypothetical protein
MVSVEKRLVMVLAIVLAICAAITIHSLAIDPNDLEGNVYRTVMQAQGSH